MASRVKENKTCNSLGHREMGMKYKRSVLWGYNSKNNNFDVPPNSKSKISPKVTFFKGVALKNFHPEG